MLSRLRARFTFANVVSVIALFVALGGSSYAAIKVTGKNVKDSSLTGKDVKNSSLTGSDVRDRSLLARDFASGQLPSGSQGPQGPKGEAGAAGRDGAQGSAAASALTGRATQTISCCGTVFLAPSGESAPSGDESTMVHASPNASVVGRDLYVRGYGNPLSFSAPVTFTLRDDGSDTDVSCVLPALPPPGSGEAACNSGGATHVFGPGSDISLRATANGASSVGYVRFGWRATTP